MNPSAFSRFTLLILFSFVFLFSSIPSSHGQIIDPSLDDGLVNLSLLVEASHADDITFDFALETPPIIFSATWGSSGSEEGQFDGPSGMVADSIGNVYVADRNNHRIQKFDAQGTFLLQWGTEGTGNDQFGDPYDVVVDQNDAVYVADRKNNRIQKFDTSGNYLLQWGSQGNGAGQFDSPEHIAVDTDNNVYVADSRNYRIQKFDSDGNFLLTWGENGTTDGQFGSIGGIAVDSTGIVYVSDVFTASIQKFAANGIYLGRLRTSPPDETGRNVADLTIDENDYIHVADAQFGDIRIFNRAGEQLLQFGGRGYSLGLFDWISDIALDLNGSIYVLDRATNRIQKFVIAQPTNRPIHDVTAGVSHSVSDFPAGRYSLSHIPRTGWIITHVDCDTSTYYNPTGPIAVELFGSDVTCRIKIERVESSISVVHETFVGEAVAVNSPPFDFVLNGPQVMFERAQGSLGTEQGQFNSPGGVVVDSNGNVYVADSGNTRIQKFDANLNYITQWPIPDEGLGGTGTLALAIDGTDHLYIAERRLHKVYKFDTAGTLLTEWGGQGAGEGQFDSPRGIAVDANGFVFVTDSRNHRIQKFSSTGSFIAQWGVEGSGAGEFNQPRSIAAAPDGKLYVLESGSLRIQQFDTNGNYLSDFEFSNLHNPPIDPVKSIAFDANGHVFLATHFHIWQYDTDGSYLMQWGGRGHGDGQFETIQSVTIGAQGHIYVTDYSHRIQKFAQTESNTHLLSMSSRTLSRFIIVWPQADTCLH